jgi:hypothetical protein
MAQLSLGHQTGYQLDGHDDKVERHRGLARIAGRGSVAVSHRPLNEYAFISPR